MDNDQIQEALKELVVLGIIINQNDGGGGDNDSVTLDLVRLKRIGYTLIYDGQKPRFVHNSEFMYMYDAILYVGNKIPKQSLYSYKLLKMKMFYSSIE